MPLFDTTNTSGTFDVPSRASELLVRAVGGAGADTPGHSGGNGGDLLFVEAVSGGETYTYHIGQSATGQPGAPGPLGNGGDGGNTAIDDTADPGGGGGSASGFEDPSGTVLGRGEGGGGAGGASGDGFDAGGGGGGGSLGGDGGLGGSGSNADAEDGQDGDGTGNGGDGGDESTDGFDGGTYADGGVTVQSTGSTTDAPQVEITPRGPPLAPNNVQVTATRAEEIDVAWTDVDDTTDGVDNAEDGYRVYYSTAASPSFPADYTQGASVGSDQEAATLTGLRNGEQYTITVEAYNAQGSTVAITEAP